KETASDSVFLTWEWLYTWSRHYLEEGQLWIVLVFKNDELIGIAPFCVRSRVTGMMTIREMRFLGSEDVGSTHLDFIVRRKHKETVLRAIYRHLHEEAAGAWDLLTLSELPAESSSIDLWELMVGEAGRVMEVAGLTVEPFIDYRRRGFHRDIARAFSDKGWLRLDFLLLSGEPIAGVYGYAYRNRYSFYLPGLNPMVAARSSPGILLLFRCVEEAVREGNQEFN